MLYRRALRPLMFGISKGDPELAHERVYNLLAWISRSPHLTRLLTVASSLGYTTSQRDAREVFGLRFPNPIGLAAGFDKNGLALPALAALGFGFIEMGTITLDGQPGNPRPRLFRLPADQALINRMGFNNTGAPSVAIRLPRQQKLTIPLGISLGMTKIRPLDEADDDYLGSLNLVYPYGDYFAINVSSPNTPGLRALQHPERLRSLLATLRAALDEHAARELRPTPKPLLVKVAPDLDESALDQIVEVCLACRVNGLIAVNTTIARHDLNLRTPLPLRDEPGGLSGRPLHARAVAVVRHLYRVAGDRLPIVGVGGIFTPDDARRLLDAGASLLQLYTGFIYEGPTIARRLAHALADSPSLPPA